MKYKILGYRDSVAMSLLRQRLYTQSGDAQKLRSAHFNFLTSLHLDVPRLRDGVVVGVGDARWGGRLGRSMVVGPCVVTAVGRRDPAVWWEL